MIDVRRWALAALCAAFAACGSAGAGDGGDGAAAGGDAPPASQEAGEGGARTAQGPLVPIRVGGIEIQVEIADDEAERARGLMFRESLPRDQGMLFIYPEERTLSFWMRNTLIPLDIAYADSEGRIVDIKQMEPQTLETHESGAPARYALEMNLGWFQSNGVRIGDTIEMDF